MTGRPWTDDEIGFLQDHEDWTAKRIALELGRTVSSITGARKSLKTGKLGAQCRVPWGDDEDSILLAVGWSKTAEDLALVLPGRSAHAIHRRRRLLGLTTVCGSRPCDICGRPLVAKTCPKCGLLLAGAWFSFQKSVSRWSTYCRACNSAAARGSYDNGLGSGAPGFSREQEKKYQDITLPRATRRGQPYTEADYEVLADQSLTDLQKALLLKRTYCAVRTVRKSLGIKSKPDGLGDPERDVWIIDNPNLPLAS